MIISSENELGPQYKMGLIDLLKRAAMEKNDRINIAIP
jgi:hypothetical protein